MKKAVSSILALLAVVLVSCVFTGFAYADSLKTASVNAYTLNLRSGPGMNYWISNVLQKGEKVTVLDQQNNWSQVKTSHSTGWVYTDYLTFTSTLSDRSMSYSGIRQDLISFAKTFLGVKYVWGGSSPSGFDCSGFVNYVYGKFGVNLERVAACQANQGAEITVNNLEKGDLVFFDTNGGYDQINHVGLYIGGGKFIHASSGGGQVIISDLSQGFYANCLMRAKRII